MLDVEVQVPDGSHTRAEIVEALAQSTPTLHSGFAKKLKAGFKVGYQLEYAAFAGTAGTVVIYGRDSGFNTRPAIPFLPRPSRAGPWWTERVADFAEDTRRIVKEELSRRGLIAIVDVRARVGRDVFLTSEGIDSAQPDQVIHQRLADLKDQERQQGRLRDLSLTILMVLVAGFLIAGAALDEWGIAALAAVYALPFLLTFISAIGGRRRVQADMYEARANLDLRELLNPDEQQAHKLFQVNGLEVKRYYDQALRQRGRVFWLGVFCILSGFACAAAALYVLTRPAIDTVGEKIVVAALGALTGILANFVAALFLRMFTSIIESTVSLHNRLVATHHAHFANLLAARITDPRLKDSTLADMALTVARAPESDVPTPTAPS